MGWALPYYVNLGVMDPGEPLLKFSAGSVDPVAQIRCAAGLGFRGIEDNALVLRPTDEQERIGRALADSGLAMGCFVFGMAVRMQPLWTYAPGDGAAQTRLEAEFQTCLDSAARVGARYVTVVSGRDPEEDAYERQIDRFAANLKRYASRAQDAGLTLCIEAHSPQRPGMLLHSVREAHRVASRSESAAVRIIFDVAQVFLGDDPLVESYEACADLVAVMQLADMPGHVELGAGSLDIAELLAATQRKGFAGPYELEHKMSEPGLAGEQNALRRLSEVDAAVCARLAGGATSAN